MNIYLIIILIILAGNYLLNLVVENLNVKHAAPELPGEFEGYFDAQKYEKSQDYLKENTRFGLVSGTVSLVVMLIVIFSGLLNTVDAFARGFNLNYILTGLIFAGVLLLGFEIYGIPFSAYHTFVIEEKYGFNKTTVKTFVLDFVKNLILACVIGGVVFSFVLWFFAKTGAMAWVYCWAAVTLFEFFIMFVAPVVIMPLFNKFIPLEEGELKSKIEDYAKSENFKMKGLFKMDSSKRSTKSNAFFTGFGRYRRIVLFDTLIARHTADELVSVLAHEMGHYKKKHIVKMMAASVATTGLMFFLLSLFMENRALFSAFRIENTSVYASFFLFGIIYTPVNMLINVVNNFLSRKYEYESDRYAVLTYSNPGSMITALKKLSVDNLSNLTPHPLKVFLEYSHPPVLERIKAIKKIQEDKITRW